MEILPFSVYIYLYTMDRYGAGFQYRLNAYYPRLFPLIITYEILNIDPFIFFPTWPKNKKSRKFLFLCQLNNLVIHKNALKITNRVERRCVVAFYTKCGD